MGKIVAALRYMGVDAIYDTTFGADMTVIEETKEFIERVENNENLPLMTSCCPGWIKFVETKYPEFLPWSFSEPTAALSSDPSFALALQWTPPASPLLPAHVSL